MKKYWILNIHSLRKTFSIIETGESFTFQLKLGVSRRVLDAAVETNIQPGDLVLGYVNEPIQEIRYVLEIVDVQNEHIELQKLFETSIGVTLETIKVTDESTYNGLHATDPSESILLQVTEEAYEKFACELVPPFMRDKTEQPRQAKKPSVPVDKPHNLIVLGPPGSGKSHKLEADRERWFGDNYERVTFHPSYSHGQFVGTYKPRPKKDASGHEYITYEFVEGPFLRLLTKAFLSDENFVLVIEELNRANAQAVFGEIFQLLDREDGVSKYKIDISEDMKSYLVKVGLGHIEKLYLPDNFYIWATMNTADQGVEPMDSAFTRRFDREFVTINANEKVIKEIQVRINGFNALEWNDFRRTLNHFLMNQVRGIKEDKLIGPFFIGKKVLRSEAFSNVFKNKLLSYLAEDVLKHNKTKLFAFPSFSEILEQYNEGKNVFNEEFSVLLRKLEAQPEGVLEAAASEE